MSLESTQSASQVRVRYEEPPDIAAIGKVNEAAFNSPVEAKVVDALRSAGFVTLSMVAVIGAEELVPREGEGEGAALSALGGEGGGWGGGSCLGSSGAVVGSASGGSGDDHGAAHVTVVGGEVIGHALVTPVTLTSEQGEQRLLGLGPVAVLPEHQGRGIGTLLIETCLEQLRDSDIAGVVVVGDPGYYGRFGFITAARWGLRWEVEAPEEVFMALELSPGQLAGKCGVVRYRPEFGVSATA